MKKILTVLFCLSLTVLACSLSACQLHEHSFAKTLSYNETVHWYAATCEHTEEKSCLSFHTFGEWQTVIEPTYEAKGEEKRSCVCGYYETRDVDPIPSSLGLEYTENADGTYAVSNIGTCTDKDVIIPETHNGKAVTGIEHHAFYEYTNLTSVVIPDSVTSIGNFAFERCTSLTSVTIPDSATSIGNFAFVYCYHLTSVTIGSKVTSVGEGAFRYCDSLTSVTIGNGVTSIGEYAFANCTSLTSVIIPDSVTSIGNYAFRNCTSLASVTIGNSVTSIGKWAFYECTNLTSVTIPSSITSIGNYAFCACASLTRVYYGGTESIWSKITIGSYNTLLTSAHRYYYSKTQPTTAGNYWHYVNGVPTVW